MKKIMAIIVSTFIALVVSVGATGCDTIGGTNSTTTTTEETTEYVTTTEGDLVEDEYDAENYITETAIKEAMLGNTYLVKAYTPEIGRIEYIGEDTNVTSEICYKFEVTGRYAGCYGDYLKYKSGGFNAEIKVDKKNGHVYGIFTLLD